MKDLYRQLPKVDRLLEDDRLSGLPRGIVVAAGRAELTALRAGIGAGTVTEIGDVAASVLRRTDVLLRGRLRPVINATGIVIHTNLGRSAWAPRVRDAAFAAAGYCNLEMDLASGERGGRLDGIEALLRHLTGAESALIVNNCAAAVLLALTALARGKEVVVSRGELVEIGGSFRVPDVISSGGARMVEVGTTNRTRESDYEAAITPDTAVLLKVHTSNFRVVGFTDAPSREALVQVGARHGVPVVEDLGSGSIEGRFDEPAIRTAVSSGLDLVLFSGDKLLGGPQAGFCVGKAEWIRTLRKHPLYRALRVDKVILAAAEQSLAMHAAGEALPTNRMIDAPIEVLTARAEQLRERLCARGVDCVVRPDVGFVGGGALPGRQLPTAVVAIEARRLKSVTHLLRTGEPSVVPRVADDLLILDVRTVEDDELDELADRVASVLVAM
jgi:L-seryl-tRNA(Ser) seleniumtransferase